MNNKDFLRLYPLTIFIPSDRIADFKKILLAANESFPIVSSEEQGRDPDGSIFYIRCETTHFAEGYFHLGALCGKFWADKQKGLLL